MHTIKSIQGFTLVEMAVVLVIIGLLLAGALMPLSAQMEQRRNSETQKALDEINQALIGFAVANGRLPCPAPATTATGSSGAGLEGTTGTGSALTCTNVNGVGVLPWATLGVNETDSWGRRYTYRVTVQFARGATGQTAFTGTACPPPTNPLYAAFALCSQGDLTINSSTAGSTVSDKIPAVVISHGNNGNGAYTSQGTPLPAGADADEQDNQLASGNTTFISKAATSTFDDLVAWVSPNSLMNRMVTAGKLP